MGMIGNGPEFRDIIAIAGQALMSASTRVSAPRFGISLVVQIKKPSKIATDHNKETI
ncbi:MAG: hypothetical protein ACI814_004377 [Mariniblastus sp.]|jgi:hypothetical protein